MQIQDSPNRFHNAFVEQLSASGVVLTPDAHARLAELIADGVERVAELRTLDVADDPARSAEQGLHVLAKGVAAEAKQREQSVADTEVLNAAWLSLCPIYPWC